ncbi:uncharacterized protein LOC107035461 [Diachasma alloeum]|uniref:uncharacterized protein LOC107035461 n=1 Tax=Diachasma alloeum TaxID=454923 RepID=UPI00073813C3|nr:uncharacterized protein LOC107035461 [Diachasma alloeum]
MASTPNWSHGLQGTRVDNKITSNESDSLAEVISVLENKVEALNIKPRLGNDLLADLEKLSLEFNELTRKFNALKETEKTVGKNHHQKRKKKLLHKFSQTDENPILAVSEAKSTIAHCILQLLSINHLLDGNEGQSVVIQKLLTHQCFDNSGDNFIIQSLSVGPVYFEVRSQGIYDEQEMQTDPSSKSNTREQDRRNPKEKSCNWLCCFGGPRKKKMKKKPTKK